MLVSTHQSLAPSCLAPRLRATRPVSLSCSRAASAGTPLLRPCPLHAGRSASPRSRAAVQAAGNGAAAEYIENADGFRIEQVSFGSILTPLGIFLLSYGFGAFFQILPGADIAAVMLVYGFPIALLGFALSYAQLKPVPCKTSKEALALRDTQMTDIQKQLREDVTRFRYGDEQHLDEALTRIFQFNRATGIARRLTPVLRGVREEAPEGAYTLVLEFSTKPEMTLAMWSDRVDKFKTFFGPGISADVKEVEGGVDVYLKTDGSGAGRGGGEQKDVLPPLMPGLKARKA